MSKDTKYSDLESTDPADLLLQQLLFLKRYERPDPERMSRNKKGIMREVREVKAKQITLGERIELHLPWLFSEPRYGIALLFIAFGLLQFVGVNVRRPRKIKAKTSAEELFSPTSTNLALSSELTTPFLQTNIFKLSQEEPSFSFFPTTSATEFPFVKKELREED